MVSSTISRVEVIRSAHRHRLELLVEARRRLELIEMVAMTEEILSRAGDVETRELRSLDAIHLATALSMKSEVQEFITYDRRLFEASARLGFEVSSPR